MKTPINKDEWPLKPRGQAPLKWAMTSDIRISNGMRRITDHCVHTRTPKREGT